MKDTVSIAESARNPIRSKKTGCYAAWYANTDGIDFELQPMQWCWVSGEYFEGTSQFYSCTAMTVDEITRIYQTCYFYGVVQQKPGGKSDFNLVYGQQPEGGGATGAQYAVVASTSGTLV